MAISGYFEDYNQEELGRPLMTPKRALFYTLFDCLIFGVKWGIVVLFLFMCANAFGTAVIKSLAINVCPLMK